MNNELLKELQQTVQSQDIDLFIEVMEKETNEKDTQVYFNILCEIIQSFSQFDVLMNRTLKILENKNDLTKNKDITLHELKQIASDFRDNLNFARGHELRREPKYNQSIADDIAETIQEKGLINYWNEHISKLHLGEHRNIYRKVLGAFNVMQGKASYLFETTASSGAGKSLEDKIAFEYMIPQQYIFRKSSMTYASFTRYSDVTPYYFDRLIVYFGDLGGKDSYKKIKDVFDVFKELITENFYSRDLTDTVQGQFENKTLELIVDSIGAVYSTIHTDFTDADDQIISRTLKSTVYPVEIDELLEFIGYLKYSKSPQSIARDNAIKELEKFQQYLLSMVNTDIEIINPFISVFMEYAKESEVISREYEQLLTLFDAYCLLTNYDCDKQFVEKGYYVASTKQIKDFFNYIALENALIPVQSNFLKMIMAEDNQLHLTIIKEADVQDLEDAENVESLSPLNIYLNTALEETQEQVTLYGYEDTIITSIEDLNSKHQEMVINRLMKYYRLNGQSREHKENVFFTVNDISRTYKSKKPYKDIDNISNLLNNLYKKGYIGKLEYKYKGSNIYYLTGKCENITKSVEINTHHLANQTNFLKNIGILDKYFE